MLWFAVAAFAAIQSDLLVQTSQVNSLKDAIIVDARPIAAYTEGHIPGALHVDVSNLSEKRGEVTGLLKPVDELRKILGDAGVDPSKRVVVYSSMETADDLKDAARLFWILEYLGYPNVAVLDGGLAKWKAENRKVESGPPPRNPLTLPQLTVRENLRATAETVESHLKQGDAIVADFRGPDYYRGEKKAAPVKEAGHIPGSVNMPAELCVADADKSIKSWDELKALAASSGLDPAKPVVAYCNTGRTASTGYLVLRLLGYDDVAVYDGSMSDWTATGTRDVKTGPDR